MRILHMGPYEAKGGISSVMRTLTDYESGILTNDVINTHSSNGIIQKIRTFIHARRLLISKLISEKIDVVHIHSASDFSFLRKIRFARIALIRGINVVFHIHSGDLSRWLTEKNRSNKYSKLFSDARISLVCLSDYWAKEFEPLLGESTVIANPVNPIHKPSAPKVDGKLCLLGRNDSVKGHQFAIELVERLNANGIPVNLHCTGINKAQSELVTCHGWLPDEEKVKLISSSQITLIPSKFEGLPVIALESLACGTNVLSNKSIFGLPDVIYSADDYDFEDWENKIVEILEKKNDVNLVDSASEFSQQKICEQWIEYYSEIVNS